MKDKTLQKYKDFSMLLIDYYFDCSETLNPCQNLKQKTKEYQNKIEKFIIENNINLMEADLISGMMVLVTSQGILKGESKEELKKSFSEHLEKTEDTTMDEIAKTMLKTQDIPEN